MHRPPQVVPLRRRQHGDHRRDTSGVLGSALECVIVPCASHARSLCGLGIEGRRDERGGRFAALTLLNSCAWGKEIRLHVEPGREHTVNRQARGKIKTNLQFSQTWVISGHHVIPCRYAKCWLRVFDQCNCPYFGCVVERRCGEFLRRHRMSEAAPSGANHWLAFAFLVIAPGTLSSLSPSMGSVQPSWHPSWSERHWFTTTSNVCGASASRFRVDFRG